MHSGEVKTLGALFFWNVEQFSSGAIQAWKPGEQEISYSSADFLSNVLRVAKWLEGTALAPGDRVAVYCENRPEWHWVDFACHLTGLVLVPVYSTLAAEQARHILQHSGARVVFCGAEQMEHVESARAKLPELQNAIRVDTLLAQTESASETDRTRLQDRAMNADPESLATIVYTSGTTGTPKGVMLSHRNIITNLQSSIERLPKRSAHRALSVLPLSHVFERMLCYGYFYRGIPIAYGDPYALKNLLGVFPPSIMGAVPRMLEKMREAIETKIAGMPRRRQRISRLLLRAGYDRLDRKPTAMAALHPLAELLMFRKIRRELGGVEAFISGGAWLNPELERYFRALGFDVIQGYGLTETAPVIACNQWGAEQIGSVGPAIDGVEVRVTEDGEILVRGPNIMMGYFQDPEATARVFQDDWFRTGDLGRMDERGYLVITGRRKEMLLLSSGKNIYYAPLEQAFRRSPLIEQAFVVGERRNYTALIIVPRMAGVHEIAGGDAASFANNTELLLCEPVLAAVRKSLEEMQQEFSRFEKVKRFCFLPEEALLNQELVTPTQKVRRNVLEKQYAPAIDRMYAQETPFVITLSDTSASARERLA